MKNIISKNRWKNITLLAMDVDGVLTDGSFYLSDDGSEMKRFSALDGIGVRCVRKLGIYLSLIHI